MSTWENRWDRRRVFDSCLTISILLLLLHFYYCCSDTFYRWGWMPSMASFVLSKIAATGFFDHAYFSKLLALLFMALALLGPSGYKSERIGWRSCAGLILAGVGLYFLD